ncbi:MAG: protein TolR [Desulfobacterales bacterium CG23_combo_of_CG06-09_8_20_14_all_52_9]|nr:MAG: protein TolR [Desulfobacterales bacterium CG23_combo_of_CG06-09_8_20_14_all_52_9]
MTAGGKENGFLSDINVTPFVDVMLVLLIIFMVTAPMMIHGANVSLPEATLDPISSEKDHLLITLDTQQRIFINDFEVKLDFLGEKLAKILENRTDREVYLRADKAIPYGMVIQVMSEIKGAGVEKLGMVTEPVKKNEKRQPTKVKRK